MAIRKTHFEQVPLEIARKIAAEELRRKEVSLKIARNKRKTGGVVTEVKVAGAWL
ncbi:MAG: hypothetical protein WA211_04480 [Candidatus Acidiferrales bacterium]